MELNKFAAIGELTPSAIRLRYKFYVKALSHSSTQDTKHLLPNTFLTTNFVGHRYHLSTNGVGPFHQQMW
jgi:hypothetical protein